MTTIVLDRPNRCVLRNSHHERWGILNKSFPAICSPAGLIAMTGSLSFSETQEIGDWILDDKPKPEIKLDPDQIFNLVVLLKSGEARLYFSDLTWNPIDYPVDAFGSGCVIASTALYLGRNPLKALKAAIDLDSNTYGEPRIWHLDRGEIQEQEYLELRNEMQLDIL